MWVIIAAILVLVITAVALLQVYDSYKSGNTQMASQGLQQQVGQVVAVILNTYAQNPNLTGFNGQVARQIGALPSSWTGNADPINLPNGGTVTFAAVTQGTAPNPNAFTMTFKGLGKDACNALGTFSLPQMVSVNVNNGGATFVNPAYGQQGTWPPVANTVAATCSANDGSDTVVYTIMG